MKLRKRGIASFKGTVAEFRKELKAFREFMKFVAEQEWPLPIINIRSVDKWVLKDSIEV